MNKAYFDSAGGLVVFGSYQKDNFLIKNALLLVEGFHKDNKGKVHEFPASRVQRIIDNSNSSVATGVELPLMIDHAKELLNSGELKKLGELHTDHHIECRIIQERDLPNPKMRHLIGKLGAFGKFIIRNRVKDVEDGLIKLLSPGIDLESERIAEVSAVAFPAIHGPALFRAADNDNGNRAYFSISYAEAKEQYGLTRKVKAEAQEAFDIMFRVLTDVDMADSGEMIGIAKGALKLKAASDFYADLLQILGLDQEQIEAEPEQLTNIEPYAPMPQAYEQQYSEGRGKREDRSWLEFTTNEGVGGMDEGEETSDAQTSSSFLLPPSFSLKKRRRN
jgi:hypothetical protein